MIKISGLFHKKHIGKAEKEGMYICLQCRSEVVAKEKPIKRKRGRPPGSFRKKIGVQSLQTQKHKMVIPARKSARLKKTKTSLAERISIRSKNHKKVVASKPLRRSGRQPKHVIRLQDESQVPAESKKRKLETKRGRGRPKKVKKEISIRKERSERCFSYWVKGLLLSRKPDDEQVKKFQKDRYYIPLENSEPDHDQPKCHLCDSTEAGSAFIACEICGGNPFSNLLLVHIARVGFFSLLSFLLFFVMFVEWYHGDAYGLNKENASMVIGFRCHLCRKQASPICPHM